MEGWLGAEVVTHGGGHAAEGQPHQPEGRRGRSSSNQLQALDPVGSRGKCPVLNLLLCHSPEENEVRGLNTWKVLLCILGKSQEDHQPARPHHGLPSAAMVPGVGGDPAGGMRRGDDGPGTHGVAGRTWFPPEPPPRGGASRAERPGLRTEAPPRGPQVSSFGRGGCVR